MTLQRFVPSTLCTRAWLGATALQAVLVCGFEAAIVWKGSLFHTLFGDAPTERSVLPVYLGIFLLANLFQLGLSVDAIGNRNIIEICGLDLFQLMLFAYSIVQISEVRGVFDAANNRDNSVIVLLALIPSVLGIVSLIYLGLTWPIWKEFGWDVFKSMGADRRIKRCFFAYQIFVAHLKFDFFILVAFSLQLVLLVLQQGDVERYLTIAAVPVTLAILVMGFVAVRREHKPLTVVFMIMIVLAMAYFAFKIFRVYQNPGGIYTLVTKSLTGFASLALLSASSTLFVTVRCFQNFGYGLKSHLGRAQQHRRTRSKAAEAGYSPEASPQYELDESSMYKLRMASNSRMSID